MKVDRRKFFLALLVFCAMLIAIGIHDYREEPDAIFESAAKSLLLFLGAVPFILLYRNLLSRKVDYLSNEIHATSEKLYETTTILEEKVEEKTKELLDEGFQDPLTHLSNRHRLIFDMNHYDYYSLIIIHLQNFKELKHFFGNAIGDTLLQQFGIWLERMHYNGYRLGSNEFALLVEQSCSDNELSAYCEKLIKLLSEHSFSAGMESVSLTIRMGIHTGEELSLACADIALQSAIDMSKSFMFYKPNGDIQSENHHNIETASKIREAFDAGRIICYYQPIVSTGTGKVETYETLARLIDTNGTVATPPNFLDVAQKTRLYPQITQEIVRQACDAFKDRDEQFSVNLCSLDISNFTTIRFIEATILETNTTNRIIFELSEKDIYENYAHMSLFIQHAKHLGAKIAIDNFGSSYSNFDKIVHLDIDYLKIDGSLITKITHSQKDADVVQTIASFATAIGIETIAENVETAAILTHLQKLGIHYAQGYHIGEPAPL